MAEYPLPEVNEAIRENGGADLNQCMQCGLCASVCPWREVEGAFFPRQMIRLGQLGLEGYESEDVLYGCTTCNKCVINCPREVNIIDIVRSMRSMITEAGMGPETLKAAAGSCRANGNPWSEPRQKRADWAKGLVVPAFGPDTEYLLFVCCTSCYDLRSQNIARSLVELLNKAGVSYGIIGAEESCCGESIRKGGDEEQFQRLARANIELFNGRGVKKIITTSPHCLEAFSVEYTELGGQWEVIHHSQLLARLVADGALELDGAMDGSVAYHDPCYLGRHCGVFEEPRELLRAAGADLAPMERQREFSLCCGGGGGRIWLETPVEKRFSVLRVQEAARAGAQVLATACPYCVSLLEDSRKTEGLQDSLQVMDICELLAAHAK